MPRVEKHQKKALSVDEQSKRESESEREKKSQKEGIQLLAGGGDETTHILPRVGSNHQPLDELLVNSRTR